MKYRREITLKSNVTSNGLPCEIVRELWAREPREVCQPRILVLAIPDVKSRGDEVIVYMALFHLDDKRQKCAPVMARDRTPVVTVVLTQLGSKPDLSAGMSIAIPRTSTSIHASLRFVIYRATTLHCSPRRSSKSSATRRVSPVRNRKLPI